MSQYLETSVADPNPRQIERYNPQQSDNLNPDPHQFEDDKPECMEYEPI